MLGDSQPRRLVPPNGAWSHAAGRRRSILPMTIAYTLPGAALVGALACAPPTLRGLRIEPSEVLRE